MKYDYGRMSIGEIHRAYRQLFSRFFCAEWDDELEPHRQEIIDCIESGTPQDMSKLGNYDLPEGTVA